MSYEPEPNPKVRTLLVSTLPDIAKEIDDDAVREVERIMRGEMWHPEFKHLGVTQAEAWWPREEEGVTAQGYLVRATHSRLTGAGRHEFTGEVPMMRVPLPEKQRHVLRTTHLGDIVDGDHKLYSLEVFRDYYRDYMPAAKRVDLITPVRLLGHRFAAVAIYLVYFKKARPSARRIETPDAFVFEAGMATGKPMVLYASRDMATVDRRAGYKPTPFSSVDHFYRGSLTMDQDEPRAFEVEIRKSKHDDEPFFRLSATLERRDNLAPIHPLKLTLQAALRVCAIADARGEEVPDLGPLTGLLAPLGRKLDWNEEPKA